MFQEQLPTANELAAKINQAFEPHELERQLAAQALLADLGIVSFADIQDNPREDLKQSAENVRARAAQFLAS
jgi:hypothetical protein